MTTPDDDNANHEKKMYCRCCIKRCRMPLLEIKNHRKNQIDKSTIPPGKKETQQIDRIIKE